MRIFVLLAVLLACPALADPGGFAPVSQRAVTLSQAVDLARQKTGGQVLSAISEGENYRIKLITPSGEVIVVLVDSRTGTIR